MPTYITSDLVPPVLALPTGSRRGTWGLSRGPLGATLTHRSIIRAFRADGAVLSDEDFTVHTDSRRSDWYVYDGAAAGRPQGHFDFECTTLNYVLPAGRSWPQLSWTGATIQSDEDHKGFEKWWNPIEAAFLAFGKIRTEEQRRRSHHAPVNVTLFVGSAGGGIMEVTDALLPSAKGRSGRHYERQHL